MNETNCKILGEGLERCLDSCIKNISKQTVVTYCNGDLQTASECLRQWAAEGKLEILKPLESANDDEEVVLMKSYIEGKSPWPNWP